MDALLVAALAAAGPAMPRIVVVPTAVARHRPELAVSHARRAFEAAADRQGRTVDVGSVPLLDRRAAERASDATLDRLSQAHLVHLPGGDPDLLPTVLPGTSAWAAIVRAVEAGGCLAGASAGAMAMAERLWTSTGAMDGFGMVPGCAVLPHFTLDRLPAWRQVVDGPAPLCWIGIDEQTLLLGEPGAAWRVAGRGSVRVFEPGSGVPWLEAGAGEVIRLP
jgi:cyanophycinase-like exopeptidase